MNLKKIVAALLICATFSVQANTFPVDPIGDKRVVKKVRKLVKSGKIDESKSCLDEYLKRHRSLAWKVGWIPPLGVATTAASYPAGMMVGMLAGALTGNFVGVAMFGVLTAIAAVGTSIGVFTSSEIKAIVRYRQAKAIVKGLGQAYTGEGKFLGRLHKAYRARTGEQVELQDFALKLVELDKTSAACDGTITGKPYASLRKRLASVEQIFDRLKMQ